MEDAPVGDNQARGLVENTVQNSQGQFRVAKDAVEGRRQRRLDGECPAAPPQATRSAKITSRSRKDSEDFAAHTGNRKGGSLADRWQSLRATHIGEYGCGSEFVWRVESLSLARMREK